MFWWIFFGLLTPLMWGLANIGDRFLCSRIVKNEYALTLAASILRLPFFFVFWFLSGWFMPPWQHIVFLIFSGIFYIFPFLFYYKALKEEETSRVMLLYYATSPLVTFVYSMIFLGERFSFYDIAASFFLLLAAFFSVVKLQKGFFHFRTGALWVLFGSLMWPVSDIIVKYLTPFFPSTHGLFAWKSLGGFLAGFLLFLSPVFARNCRKENFKWPGAAWIILVLNVIVFQAGLFAFLKALALERVALTVVLTAAQPLMVFALEFAVRRIYPRFDEVDAAPRSLFAKAVAFICMVFGIWLFTF